MIKKIYLLQQKEYYGYDSADGENVEECMVVGYFTSLKLVDDAKKNCIDNGVDERNLEVQTFEIPINNNQKFVYILSHSYSIRQADGTFSDFEYIFEPQSNNAKCLKFKEKLKLEPKYKNQANRDYSLYPPDGFCVDKYRLDCIYFPIYKMLSG